MPGFLLDISPASLGQLPRPSRKALALEVVMGSGNFEFGKSTIPRHANDLGRGCIDGNHAFDSPLQQLRGVAVEHNQTSVAGPDQQAIALLAQEFSTPATIRATWGLPKSEAISATV